MSTSSEGVISIIVPILNEEKTIARTLGHLQAFDEGQEVIVVDGGSEDRSREEASPSPRSSRRPAAAPPR